METKINKVLCKTIYFFPWWNLINLLVEVSQSRIYRASYMLLEFDQHSEPAICKCSPSKTRISSSFMTIDPRFENNRGAEYIDGYYITHFYQLLNIFRMGQFPYSDQRYIFIQSFADEFYRSVKICLMKQMLCTRIIIFGI